MTQQSRGPIIAPGPASAVPQVGEEQRVNRTSTTARRIRPLVLAAATLAIAMLGSAGIASAAHVQVDPTTLTPPLQPYRVCYLDGQSIRCDTSTPASWANVPVFDLPCGTVYETATRVARSVRYYNLDKLLVERNAEEEINGIWTLSPTGSGPALQIRVNDGWHEHFVIPGDLDSDVERAHGSFLHVISLGNVILDVGIRLEPSDTGHGYFLGENGAAFFEGTDPVKEAILCAALAP
jgi:hypothetical protein